MPVGSAAGWKLQPQRPDCLRVKLGGRAADKVALLSRGARDGDEHAGDDDR